MILNQLITWLCDFLEWVAGLLPTWHLQDAFPAFINGLAAVWTQAYTWSGVFPITTVLDIIGFIIALIGVLMVYFIVVFVLNIVRGSGAG